MTEIRAFIGHSFNGEDEEIVGKFLKYFEELKNMGLGFTWAHAEAAEPKDLAKKVLSILEDKNVFIGICTKKESVIKENQNQPKSLWTSIFQNSAKQFEWKTSDWIIQEIGLAIGKGLDLILLLEENVREPGGLQSNMEYISFTRNAPERSYVKILQMITSLTPRSPTLSEISSDITSSKIKEDDPDISPEIWTTPQPTWGRYNYEFALFRAIINGNDDDIATISSAYLETQDASKNGNNASWIAYAEYTRLMYGKGGSLKKLQVLANENSENSTVLEFLAKSHEVYQDYLKAANIYKIASVNVSENAEAVRLLGCAAGAVARAGSMADAQAIAEEMKLRVDVSEDAELELLKALKTLAEIENNDQIVLSLMERIIELCPDDNDARFSLAYKHSQCGNNDLALLHYTAIPYHERTAITWNNLGVEFDHFSMPSKAVEAFRRAIKDNETLPMANLANKFISEGFLAEAEEQCNRAVLIKDFHQNIGWTIKKLKEIPKEEELTEKKTVTSARKRSDFYKKFGRASSQSDVTKIVETWDGPDCILTVALNGRAFSAAGTYERVSTGMLSAALAGTYRTSSNDSPIVYRLEYRGTFRGRAIIAQVTRVRVGERSATATLLGSARDSKKALMVLSADGKSCSVMESSDGSDPNFYTITAHEAKAGS